MIIGIDSSRANKKRKTGTEWYSYYLIKYLAQIDNKNEYILYSDCPLRGGLADLTKEDICLDNHNEKIEFKEGQQIIKSPFNNFKVEILNWPFSYLWTLGRLSLQMLIKKPDVLFVPAHGIPLIRPKKTVNTIHDLAFKSELNLFERSEIGSEVKIFRKILNIITRIFTFGKYRSDSLDYLEWSTGYSLKKSRKIIAISNFTKKEILRIYGASPEKIEVIYQGFNDFLYRKINDEKKIEEVLKKHGIEKPYFLYVGRLEKKKNTSLLIEAFAKAKYYNKNIKEKMVLVGNASFGYDEVKYVINEFQMENEVIMPGWVEEHDMPYIYNGASAFIFPTRYEGFGIPILQAFGCGVPVIASDIPVFREIGADAVLFFNQNHKEDIARAIEKIATDADLRKKLSEKGILRAREFNWRKCAEETLKVIENL